MSLPPAKPAFASLEPEYIIQMVSALYTTLLETAPFSCAMEELFPFVTERLALLLIELCPRGEASFRPKRADLLSALTVNTADADSAEDVFAVLDLTEFEDRVLKYNGSTEYRIQYSRPTDGIPLCHCFLPSLGLGFRLKYARGLPVLEAARAKRMMGAVAIEYPRNMWRLDYVWCGEDMSEIKAFDLEWKSSVPATVGVLTAE